MMKNIVVLKRENVLENRLIRKTHKKGLRQVENGNLPPMENYSKKIIYKILRDHKTRKK